MEKLKRLLKTQHSLYNTAQLKLEKEILPLIKGTVVKRHLNGKIYYYLCFRKGKHVHNRYLSTVKPMKIVKEIEKRRKLIKELREVKKALKMLRSVRPRII